ncbi:MULTISPECIES: hypothetical protein [unclassified Frankia]|nr:MULTISPECIES: hypothetical protein [unclassified Frankia]
MKTGLARAVIWAHSPLAVIKVSLVSVLPAGKEAGEIPSCAGFRIMSW